MKTRWMLISILILVMIPGTSTFADLSSGTLDTGFDTSIGVNNLVYAVAYQPDGKVLIGGDFSQHLSDGVLH